MSKIFVPQFSVFLRQRVLNNYREFYAVTGELGERFTVILPGYRSAQNYTDYRGFSGGVPRVIRKVILGKSALVSNVQLI